MAQQGNAPVALVVAKRGNGKAAGVVYDGKTYKIGEKFSAPKSDANYLIATGKCELAPVPAAKEDAKK
jgi:hypothetical protein